MILGLIATASALAQPTLLFSVAPRHRLIEGVATDGRTVWVSSVLDRQILKCRKSCAPFATLPKDLHPMGMAWDSARKRIWIAADCPELKGVGKCERGALVGLNEIGRLVTRVAPPGGSFHPGDVSASAEGVFISDSQNGAVHRLSGTGAALEAVVAVGVGNSAQGSAIDETGGKLVVADYSQGIAVVDLATGTRSVLKQADDRPVRGIDGLIRCGNAYYGIYNGGALPPGLVRFTFSGDRIMLERPIQAGALVDPTQLAVDGERIVLVGNAGWEGAAKGAARIDPAPILAFDPPESCEN
ncbi:MAG TPA: hypothetical protein VFH89_10640 [Sphingomicrobium sp.]|nr:hypothetical protein [Sphingomicrobium sp.]